jgi:hypothetical protein
MQNSKHTNVLLSLVWVGFGAMARLVPHLPNFTPTTSLCLFAGSQFSRKQSLAMMTLVMVLSDIALAQIHGLGAFGWWSIFTYSGFAVIVAMGGSLRNSFTAPRALGLSLTATTGFWLWTNFGTWLVSGMYEKTTAGLLHCYVQAIPFLGWSLVGDLAWMLGLFLSFDFAKSYLAQSKSTVPVSK